MLNEKKVAQRLKAEGRLVSNIEKSQRYMEKYVHTEGIVGHMLYTAICSCIVNTVVIHGC